MYEPTFLPKMKKAEMLLGNVKYYIHFSDDYVDPKSPNIEQLHLHDYVEVFFNVSSDVSFLINGKLCPVAYGEAIISYPNEVHVCVYNTAKKHSFYCLWVDVSNSPFLSSCFDNLNHLSFTNEIKKEIFEQLLKLYNLQDSQDEIIKTSTLLRILELIKHNSKNNKSKTILPNSFQKILDYININFNEIKSVQDIATAHYISTATLLRDFKKYLRVSPKKYLEQIKLSNAVEMLNNGFSVTESAINSGFLDVSHFIALFKKKFGVTPHKYKNGN